MNENNKTISVKVKRGAQGTEESRYDTYQVPFEEKMSVLTLWSTLATIWTRVSPFPHPAASGSAWAAP